MSQSLAKIVVHTIFSTKDRQPLLKSPELRGELYQYLGGILLRIDCQPVIVGGTEDHVHVLCALSRNCEPSKMVQEMKRVSSVWLKTKGPEMNTFAWQKGYGMFSIGQSQIETARRYIKNQEKHHQKVSFQDEFRQVLRRYEMSFDERYVWD